MTRRAVKPKSAPPIRREGAIPITTPLNISALAREHGVSRKTIQRRLANGWRPDAPTPAPTPRIRAQAHPKRAVRIAIMDHTVTPMVRTVTTPRTPVDAHARESLGVVRGVLLLLGVAFYVFVACAAVGVRG